MLVSASFERENTELPAQGTLSLRMRTTDAGEVMPPVGQGTILTQPGKFGLGGGGLVVGRSGAEAVVDYAGERPWPFVGGTIRRVVIDVSGDPHRDLALEAAAAFARQ